MAASLALVLITAWKLLFAQAVVIKSWSGESVANQVALPKRPSREQSADRRQSVRHAAQEAAARDFMKLAAQEATGTIGAGLDGCYKNGDVLLCKGLPELGDGVCNAADLQHILATVQRSGWHGDKVGVIRSEAPRGWLPVPALRQTRQQPGAPTSAWQTLHSQGVYMLDGFLTDKEADSVVAQINKRQPITSEVDAPALPTCGFRRSTTWVFWDHERDRAPFPGDLGSRFERVTSIQRAHYEPMQVVEYQPGDFFSDHYDTSACDHMDDHQLDEVHGVEFVKHVNCNDGLRRQGTLIVYLTDESAGEGGATYFPKLGIRVTPKRGRALFFRPTRADGSSDPFMLHSAETQLSGRKYLLQQWMMHGV